MKNKIKMTRISNSILGIKLFLISIGFLFKCFLNKRRFALGFENGQAITPFYWILRFCGKRTPSKRFLKKEKV